VLNLYQQSSNAKRQIDNLVYKRYENADYSATLVSYRSPTRWICSRLCRWIRSCQSRGTRVIEHCLTGLGSVMLLGRSYNFTITSALKTKAQYTTRGNLSQTFLNFFYLIHGLLESTISVCHVFICYKHIVSQKKVGLHHRQHWITTPNHNASWQNYVH